jgi:hypothetical protein
LIVDVEVLVAIHGLELVGVAHDHKVHVSTNRLSLQQHLDR